MTRSLHGISRGWPTSSSKVLKKMLLKANTDFDLSSSTYALDELYSARRGKGLPTLTLGTLSIRRGVQRRSARRQRGPRGLAEPRNLSRYGARMYRAPGYISLLFLSTQSSLQLLLGIQSGAENQLKMPTVPHCPVTDHDCTKEFILSEKPYQTARYAKLTPLSSHQELPKFEAND